MLSIIPRLLAIVAALRHAVAVHAAALARGPHIVWLGSQAYTARPTPCPHKPLPAETWALLTTRLGRLAARLHALFARWQAGTPIPQRPSRANQPRSRAPYPRLPTAQGWINARITAAAPCAGNLHFLLQEPSTPAFLAEIPQAARLLRPLCRMLAIPLPACLRLPPRPARARPAKPPPPTPDETPDRPLQPYLRAAARAWRRRGP